MSKKDDDDNRSRQLNPEHDAYWQSRGYDERPDDEDFFREPMAPCCL